MGVGLVCKPARRFSTTSMPKIQMMGGNNLREYENYESYDYDRLTEGSNIQIDHTIYVTETDMSDLISKPISEIRAMREESITKEKTAFEKVRQTAQDWEKQAAVTRQFDRAIEYLKVPEVSHTSNKWVKAKDEFDYNLSLIHI